MRDNNYQKHAYLFFVRRTFFFSKFQNQLTIMIGLRYIFGSLLHETIGIATIEGHELRQGQQDYDEPWLNICVKVSSQKN